MVGVGHSTIKTRADAGAVPFVRRAKMRNELASDSGVCYLKAARLGPVQAALECQAVTPPASTCGRQARDRKAGREDFSGPWCASSLPNHFAATVAALGITRSRPLAGQLLMGRRWEGYSWRCFRPGPLKPNTHWPRWWYKVSVCPRSLPCDRSGKRVPTRARIGAIGH
jgi:hypothetical protein